MRRSLLNLILAVPFLFMACNGNDDDYSLDKYWLDIATVENPESSNAFYIMRDDSVRLWMAAPTSTTYRPKDGQRIIANYTILNDKPDGSNYNHDMRLNSVYEVLTKGIFEITPATKDSIGNDAIEITSMWVGSKSHFLNVEFRFYGFNKMHFINLVHDADKTYSDGKIHLEFRHNNNNDEPAYRQNGIASFDLRSLQDPANDTSLKIVVHTNEYGADKEKTHELTYKYGNATASSVAPKKSFAATNWVEVQ